MCSRLLEGDEDGIPLYWETSAPFDALTLLWAEELLSPGFLRWLSTTGSSKICEVWTSSLPKMYQISQLMSTPVASKCSSGSKKEHAEKPSPTCIFRSLSCDFLDGDSSFECCSIDPLTGSHFSCRRSPRLLTNGYYVWTEDSFLFDKDGNITLSPSQTSVLYKENLVRIFRKKKRIRRSFSSLFNFSPSESWLHGSRFDDVDSSPSEDIWLEGVRRLDAPAQRKWWRWFGLFSDWWVGVREAECRICESILFRPCHISDSQRKLPQPVPSVPVGGFWTSPRERFESCKSQFVARGFLSSDSACCMLNHFCVCKMVSGRTISQCLHMPFDDNYYLCCQIIVSPPDQLFQSHRLCSVCQNLTTI